MQGVAAAVAVAEQVSKVAVPDLVVPGDLAALVAAAVSGRR